MKLSRLKRRRIRDGSYKAAVLARIARIKAETVKPTIGTVKHGVRRGCWGR